MEIDFGSLPDILGAGIAFDIDETLSNTIYALVDEMKEIFGNPENLLTEEIIRKYRYTWDVPFWNQEEAKPWVQTRIREPGFFANLPLMEEHSVDVVNRLSQKVPIVAYITMRPEAVEPGTLEWLSKTGFPDAPVISRPPYVSSEQATDWKAKVLERLHPGVLGIVDDQPLVLESLGPNYSGRFFYYNPSEISDYSYVIPCRDINDVYEKVMHEFRDVF